MLKSTIIPDIIKQLEATIKTTVEGTIDKDLSIYGTMELIPKLGGVMIDYAQMTGSPAVTTDNVLELAVNGTFIDVNHQM